MNRQGTKRRGFALIATLAAITLAMLLLSAFLQANRSYFALARLDDDKVACDETIESAAEFMRYALEKNRSWGRPDSDGRDWEGSERVETGSSKTLFTFRKVRPGTPVENGLGLQGYAHLVGSSPEIGTDVQISFSNNLNNDDAHRFEILKDGDGNEIEERVPEKTCFVRIAARRGEHVRKVEMVLRRAAYFDSTLASSNGIHINTENLTGGETSFDRVVLNSRDPVRNQIRSGGSIKLPSISHLAFRTQESDPPPTQGTIWAKDFVRIGRDEGNARANEERLNEAIERHKIEVVQHAKNHFNVPELTADDIASGVGRNVDPVILTPKRYVFTQATVEYEHNVTGETRQVQMRILKEVDSKTRTVEAFHFNGQDIREVPGSARIIPKAGEAGNIPSDLRGTNRGGTEFTVDNGIRIELRGEDFEDTGVESRSQSEPRVILPKYAEVRGDGTDDAPSFGIFSDSDVLVPKISFGGGEDSNKTGYLSAKGNITLEGYLEGGGKIVSREGNVNLYPNDVDIEAEEKEEFAIFAAKDVTIRPPLNENTNSLATGVVEGGEEEGVDQSDLRDLYFRGLVYAGENFTFDSYLPGTTYRRKLVVEGAIVARNGHININSRLGVSLTYDPSFLDDFLEKSFVERNVQVEELSWRPL